MESLQKQFWLVRPVLEYAKEKQFFMIYMYMHSSYKTIRQNCTLNKGLLKWYIIEISVHFCSKVEVH